MSLEFRCFGMELQPHWPLHSLHSARQNTERRDLDRNFNKAQKLSAMLCIFLLDKSYVVLIQFTSLDIELAEFTLWSAECRNILCDNI